MRDLRNARVCKAWRDIILLDLVFNDKNVGDIDLFARYLPSTLARTETVFCRRLSAGQAGRAYETLLPLLESTFTVLTLQFDFDSLPQEQEVMFGRLVAHNTTISSLILRNYDEIRPALSGATTGIGPTHNLTELELTRGLSRQTVTALSDSIGQNRMPLRKLELGGCYLFVQGVVAVAQALRTNTTLTAFSLSGEKDPALAAFRRTLQQNSTLRGLRIYGGTVSTGGLEHLAKGLAVNSGLTRLEILSKGYGVDAIGRALAVNSVLVELDMSTLDFDNSALMAIAEALEKNRNIKVRKLGKISLFLCESGVASLAKSLRVNSSLQELLLSGTLHKSFFRDASDSISLNTTLRRVDMKNGRFDPEDITMLVRGVAQNKSITSLDLYHSVVGDAGAAAIAEALLVNSTLKYLFLRHTSILSDGANQVMRALCVNSSLEYLMFSSNVIDSEGVRLVAEVLRVNSTLRYFDVTGCHIRDFERAAKMLEALADEQNAGRPAGHPLKFVVRI